MKRSTLVSAVLVAMLGVVASGQEPSDRPLLGDRLNQFRKALLGEQSTPKNTAPQATNPNSRPPITRTPADVKSPLNIAAKKTTGKTTTPSSPSPTKSSVAQDRKSFDPFDTTREPRTSTVAKTATRDSQTVERMTSVPLSEPAPSSRRRNSTEPVNSTGSSESVTASKPTVASKPLAGRFSDDDSALRTARSEKRFSLEAGEKNQPNVADAQPAKAAAPIAVATPVDDRVLITRKSPMLSVETTGPRKITVGKESIYTVSMKNTGELTAADVVVSVTVPAWAEVIEAKGATDAPGVSVERTAEGVQWKIGALAGRAQQDLNLKLVPRKSQSFELGVRWTSSPVTSQATVEVQEAKLQMAIGGPTEVIFGQQQLYKLTLLNPGNADAENVVLYLSPLTAGEGPAASHRVGTLRAGSSTSVEIELTARQAGRLAIKAEATADGDLKASAAEEVLVRRAAIQVSVAGPKVHYAGVPANFDIRLTNTGDAPARHVAVTAILPAGSELVTASQEGQNVARNGEVSWAVDQLSPGGEQVFTVRCAMKSPGANRVEAIATADGDLKGASIATTQLMALADLVMTVADTAGPVSVSQDAIYELRVRNRGTSAAENVEIVAFFSPGVEAVAVEGGLHEITNGAVVFKPIPNLAAGAEAVYKIKAHAVSPGNHRIRVELECKTLGTRLCQEDTTLFYGEENSATAK